jgi:competence protein ComEC
VARAPHAGRPLLHAFLVLSAGAAVGDGLSRESAWTLLGLAALLLGLALRTRGASMARLALAGAGLSVAAAAAAAEGIAYDSASLRRWIARHDGSERPVRLEGLVSRDVGGIDQRPRLVLEVDRLTSGELTRRLSGRVRVLVGGLAPMPDLVAGERVSLWAQLALPRGFGTPGSFDAAAQARREAVHATGFCKGALLVARAGGAPGWITRLRRRARSVLESSMPPGPEAGLVRAMVLGDRTGVDRDTAEAFRIAGTYHVLALSGAQVALVAGVLLFGLRRLRAGPAAAGVFVSFVIVLYAIFVGGDVPVARAAVMAVVMLLGRCLDLDSDLANLLGLAGSLLLLWRPSAIGDIGFQLSFAATLGILLFASPIVARFRPLPLALHLGLAASIAAQVTLAPLLAFHFHRLAPAALLLNLAAGPLAGAVLLAGFAVLAGSWLSPPAVALLGDLAWVAAHALLRSGELVRSFPALDVRVPTPSAWAVALFVAGLLALSRARSSRQGLVLLSTGLALLLGRGREPGDGRLRLTVLDVGQGDSHVLRSPQGRVFLVDTGMASERFDAGEAVVAPYLWSRGVRRIDRLVLTHADADHVGGTGFLVRNFRVGEVWESVAPRRDPSYADLDRVLRGGRARRLAVSRGVSLDWDGVAIRVEGPRPAGAPPARVRNDDSLVLSVRLGRVSFLLTGDIEETGEAALGGIEAAVLKVPHHGSRTSSSAVFLAETSPRVAVVSVGSRSPFGHPDPEVIRRYARAGIRLYRTDRDGAVDVSTDGDRIWVGSFRGGREERVR